MNSTLASWNSASEAEALGAMIACCGSKRWAAAMVALRPAVNVPELSEAADRVWSKMEEADWPEVFACHPHIGELKAARASAQSATWSRQEQSSANSAEDHVLAELADANLLYEQRFGFTYIVCATGKRAEEMLLILKGRLGNDHATELREAAEQQRQITQIRLGKWVIE